MATCPYPELTMHKILRPAGWTAPIGYENGVMAEGRSIFVGGQIGWNAQQVFETDDLAEQIEQTLKNIVAVLAEAKAGPQHLVSMTWYLTDLDDYADKLKQIGRAYRNVVGRHFPAIAVVQVVRLVERRAKVEIQAVAVVPNDP
jgi:enamine deaminase RidA (YjgF/YER057c/UK114 family)